MYDLYTNIEYIIISDISPGKMYDTLIKWIEQIFLKSVCEYKWNWSRLGFYPYIAKIINWDPMVDVFTSTHCIKFIEELIFYCFLDFK